jgi:hypothetical protein
MSTSLESPAAHVARAEMVSGVASIIGETTLPIPCWSSST